MFVSPQLLAEPGASGGLGSGPSRPANRDRGSL